MSRGRDLFRAAQPILRGASKALHILPRWFVVGLWGWVSGVPGILGVGLRYVLASRLARSIGVNVRIGEHVEIRSWENLSIGSNVSIHRMCYLEALGGITIGDDVSIAHATSVLSFEHTWDRPDIPIKDNELVLRPVRIDSDVWVGCGVRILAGVHLVSRTVVAAGAVVNKSSGGAEVIAGVPARSIRSIAAPLPK